MTRIEELIAQNKSILKGLIKEGMSKQDIEVITSLDKNLDACLEEHTKDNERISSLQSDLIKVVKETSFKMPNDPNKENVEKDQKSLDDILGEEIAKITQ